MTAGVIVLLWGINVSESMSSDISRILTGAPTDKAMWMIVAGAVCTVVGMLAAFLPSRTKS